MIQKTLAMIQKKTFEMQKSVRIQGKSEQDMSGAMRERPRKVRRSWCASVLACLMTCGPAWADSGDSWTFTLNADSTTQGLLTSGDWTLRAALTAAGSDTLGLGYGKWADTAAAYVAGSGVLDLTTPIWQGERRLSLTHVRQTAFRNLPKTVAVRRLVLPDTVADIAPYAFSGLSSVDRLTVRSTNVTALAERAFFNVANMYRLDLALPSLAAANVAKEVLSNGNAKRLLCLDVTGFGEIPVKAFGAPAVSNLVLKTVLGQNIATNAFPNGGNLRCVSFTGDRPDLSARGDNPENQVFGGGPDYSAAGTILFRVPYGNATYDAWRDEAAARPLSADELTLFRQRFPSEPDPIGWLSGATCGTYYDQVLCEFNPRTLDNALVVALPDGCSDTAGFVGCRTVHGLDDGETWAVNAPATFVANGIKYQTTGGTVARPADGAAGWTEETFDGCAYTFVQRGDEGARLTWRVDVLGYAAPSFATDSVSHPEKVTAVPDRAADADGFYPVGTTWTLTVDGLRTTLPKSRFVRWVGDVPAGHARDLPLILTPTDGTCCVRAEIQRDWLLTTGGTTHLTDGVWTLRATADAQGRVSIGNGWTAGGGYLAGPSVPTPLDLSGALTDAAGNALTLHYIGNPAFKAVANVSALRIVSDTLKAIGAEAFYGLPDLGDVHLEIPSCETLGYSCFSGNPNLTNLVLRAANLTTCAPDRPWRPFAGNAKLSRAEIRAPKLTYLTDRFLDGAPLTATDFSTWDVSSVRRLGEYAFQKCRVTDGLSLPALREVAACAFYAAKVEALSLGTKHLTNICANAFIWCGGLKAITLGNAANLTVAATAFLGDRPEEPGSSAAPARVTFLGPAPTQADIDNVIAAVPERAGAKACRIYASKDRYRRDGRPDWWQLAAAPSGEEEITAAEAEARAQAAEGRTLLGGGVYRDGSRKAWLVGITTPYDQRGFAFIVR